jgi:hypothetical protein
MRYLFDLQELAAEKQKQAERDETSGEGTEADEDERLPH